MKEKKEKLIGKEKIFKKEIEDYLDYLRNLHNKLLERIKTDIVDTLIKIEKLTASTSEQIKWIKINLSTNKKFRDLILVSDAYHLPRTIEISRFFNLNIKVAESVHKLNYEDKIYNKLRESIALFNFWNFAL